MNQENKNIAQDSPDSHRQEIAFLHQAAREHLELLRGAGLAYLPMPNRNPDVAKAVPGSTSLDVCEQEDDMSKTQTMNEMSARAETCRLCAIGKSRDKMVFGSGSVNANLVFVGEAPGAEEDLQGVPFVGRSGKLLDKMIAYLGLQRKQVYVMNTLKCRPPGNRNPDIKEMENCKPFFDGQLAVLRPKVIVALGAFAAKRLLNTDETIGRLRGRFHDYQGIPVMPTYHPAYLLRSPSPENRSKVKADLRKAAKTYLGITSFGE